jgi:hypothetical protein
MLPMPTHSISAPALHCTVRAGGQPIEKFVNAKKWRAAAERERKAKSGNFAHLKPAQGVPLALLGPRPPAWGEIKAVATARG